MTPTATGRTGGRSIRATARWAGALNVLSAVPAGFSVTVLRKLVVTGNAAATATNILRSEGMFRLGFVVDLAGLLLFVVSSLLLYEIFRPASRPAARLYMVLILLGTFSQASEAVHDLAALVLLRGGPGMSALQPAQANVMAMLFLRLHSYSYVLALFFFGCSSLVMCHLILRSTFVPRILGWLMILDGLGFLTFSLASFLSPPLAARIFPYIPMVTTAFGSGVLYLWLIFKSVNAERWQEQAAGQ